jgi:uncharacterized LabA/DUF88 family protein
VTIAPVGVNQEWSMKEDLGQKKLAVLIDADNTMPAIIEGLLEEIAKYGTSSVRRIYGDWTTPNLRSWKEVLLEHAIQPIQQFRYTVGKNATDSAMIIDAMDLLFTEKFDGFCLVSSDSDFTRLASRIREAGLTVYGFGERKTPKAMVGSCDKFIYTDILGGKEEHAAASGKRTPNDLKMDAKLIGLLRSSVEDSADDDGWAYLGSVGQNVANKAAEFDPRNYGYKKFSDLIRGIGLFDVVKRVSQGTGVVSLYVRDRRRRTSERPEAPAEARDRNGRDMHDSRDLREGNAAREPRESREVREPREPREQREPREPKEVREPKEALDPRDAREIREIRDERAGIARRDDDEDFPESAEKFL